MGEPVSGAGGAVATSTPDESRLPGPADDGALPDADPPGSWLGAGEPAPALLAAVAVAVSVWMQGSIGTVLAVVVAALVIRRWGFVVVVAMLCSVGVVRSDAAWRSLEPDTLGPFAGWVTVAQDPAPAFGATRMIVQIEGERFEVWERGRARQLRVATWQEGDRVWMVGERRQLAADRASRVAWQHVVGRFDRDFYGDSVAGRPLNVAANRVRGLIAAATSVLGVPRDSLARGLIIGDDREQPPEMVERFRASGLSHLSAVSGQNIALVVAAAGPMLRRLRAGTRLAATVALIAWFVVLTRAEPSVLRAGVMAGLGAAAFAFGREREPPRLLALAVVGLLLVDPLLCRSVGFWLSVGATAGVTILAPVLTRMLRRLGRFAMPVAVTLGAQAGVALPSLLVFGRLSVIGTVANLLAVPVAGFVMLYGLPAALVGGAAPWLARPAMLPVDAGVRWVDGVAAVAARAAPSQPVNIAGWIVVVAVVGWCAWPRRRAAGGRADGDSELPH